MIQYQIGIVGRNGSNAVIQFRSVRGILNGDIAQPRGICGIDETKSAPAFAAVVGGIQHEHNTISGIGQGLY